MYSKIVITCDIQQFRTINTYAHVNDKNISWSSIRVLPNIFYEVMWVEKTSYSW